MVRGGTFLGGRLMENLCGETNELKRGRIPIKKTVAKTDGERTANGPSSGTNWA